MDKSVAKLSEEDAGQQSLKRLCCADNWDGSSKLNSPEENAPRAIRWATRTLSRMFNDPDWGRWHYTEGSGGFTACGRPVVLFAVDGSPEERHNLGAITCRSCLAKMQDSS